MAGMEGEARIEEQEKEPERDEEPCAGLAVEEEVRVSSNLLFSFSCNPSLSPALTRAP